MIIPLMALSMFMSYMVFLFIAGNGNSSADFATGLALAGNKVSSKKLRLTNYYI